MGAVAEEIAELVLAYGEKLSSGVPRQIGVSSNKNGIIYADDPYECSYKEAAYWAARDAARELRSRGDGEIADVAAGFIEAVAVGIDGWNDGVLAIGWVVSDLMSERGIPEATAKPSRLAYVCFKGLSDRAEMKEAAFRKEVEERMARHAEILERFGAKEDRPRPAHPPEPDRDRRPSVGYSEFGYWIEPDGTVHPMLQLQVHAIWIRERLGPSDPMKAALEGGWVRITSAYDHSPCDNVDYVVGSATREALRAAASLVAKHPNAVGVEIEGKETGEHNSKGTFVRIDDARRASNELRRAASAAPKLAERRESEEAEGPRP